MSNRKVEILKESLIEKNTTFLFGAGASAPYFSSLGNFEKILSHDGINNSGKNLIKSIFYKLSVQDNVYLFNYIKNKCIFDSNEELMTSIIHEYSRLLHNSIEYLKVRNSRISPKRVNIVTTNYDLFFESAIDGILENNPRIFFNDGTNGYGKKILSSDNFNKTLLYSGIFDNYSNEMPSINLIKCHGSVNWKEHKEESGRSKIQVLLEKNLLSSINNLLHTTLENIIKDNQDVSIDTVKDLVDKLDGELNTELVTFINTVGKSSEDLLANLASEIENLQIVLPTKKKFQTTLIQEHYFSMLRLLSYELEKNQSLLVVFGFSFYDEHIRDIIERSVNNPNLLVIIFCFKDDTKEEIISQFNFSSTNIPVNIIFIQPSDFLRERISIDDFKADEYSESDYTIIKNEESVFVYHKLVSVHKGIPILNFASLNLILEENITNKYLSLDTENKGIE